MTVHSLLIINCLVVYIYLGIYKQIFFQPRDVVAQSALVVTANKPTTISPSCEIVFTMESLCLWTLCIVQKQYLYEEMYGIGI